MTIDRITNILRLHAVQYAVLDGRVIAEEWFTKKEGDEVTAHCEQRDVTEYSKRKLLEWLGY